MRGMISRGLLRRELKMHVTFENRLYFRVFSRYDNKPRFTVLLGNLSKLTRRSIGGGHIQISIQLMSGAELIHLALSPF